MPSERTAMSPAGASGLLLVVLLGLMGVELHAATGGFALGEWLRPLAGPTGTGEWLLALTWWPRLVTALIAGAGLAIAGVLMQQVLRNPLASPTTLGVAGGANLALMAASLFAPGLMLVGSEWVALAGGAAAMGLVFLLSWRQALSPLVVVLAGLVVNLYLGALAMVLLLFNQETLQGLLIWGAGSLAQDGWHDAAFLLPRLAVGLVAAWLLLRPLRVLELDDASGRSLGVNLAGLRLAALGAAVFLTGTVVSVVGLIGFIGLAAPNIARLLGAERLGARLFWAPIIGALLLAVTDLLLQSASAWLPTLIPTGAMTAALGAPLLLWLIPRLRLEVAPPTLGETGWPRAGRPERRLMWIAAALVPATLLALFSGHVAGQWTWWSGASPVWEWRLPRMLAAAGAGILLAVAGTLLQRLTGNPMASPEVLGISGGVAIFLLLGIVLLPAVSLPLLVLLGVAGALVALVVLITLNARSGFLPERLLLTGVAITALAEAVRALVLAGSDPRGQQIVAWLSGSTYFVGTAEAFVVLGFGVLAALAVLVLSRWLDLLPLGAPVSRALGVPVGGGRLAVLGVSAVLTAAATLVIGPLSFVGLLAPHMARLLGLSRARDHLLGAALIGAVLMILADWIGRQIQFPHEIPAGLVASLIGGTYFLWALRRL
ncbi:MULTISPECIES: Fe(3+)-hydroxamate ABC transporter permease FhuB [unclassified Guyparkeria]|uniref:Fe(3+)-hydroxamate ABC transporter permease FhuB n=1 Tax=unclassified Guyparkeria TaxID=2626246 RepID=UPI0007333A56|nr:MULTISPECIES: Fe(3+)-hydroxamate ABC transporter permease FhuB [unclassified Guyparkeria]KTG17692.1 iron ABC transporter [Guyparkeria sp. XI15]OAE88505.1 iron ABC transporter [Guyparkeria sp. WRN-7]